MAWQPPGWDDYIASMGSPMGLSPPPLLPPEAQQIAPMGAPVAEEVPLGVGAPPLTPAQEAQIEIDPPAPVLTPEEEAQIEIDPPPDAPQLLTPPILGEVDAVSAATPRRVGDLVDVTMDGAQPRSLDDIGAGVDQRIADAPLPSIREREASEGGAELGVEMSKRTPEEQAMFLAKLERSRNNFAASRTLEESEKTRRKLEENLKIREQATKAAQQRRVQLEERAKQIADTDPMDSIPGYRKLFGVLASFVGGFAANKTGRNIGLEAIDSIADDAAKQQAQKLQVIAREQSGVGDDINAANDAFQTSEAARLATYDIAFKGLQSEIQLFDPKGATAQRVAGMLNDIAARRAELAQKTHEADLKHIEKFLEQQRQVAEAEEKRRHNIASEDTDRTRAGSDYIRAKADMERAEADKLRAQAEAPGSAKARKAEADATKAEAEASAAEGGFFIRHPETGEPLKGKDGKPMPVMDATKRERLDKIAGAAKNIRILADRMKALKEKHGGNIEALGSDEAQEMKTAVSMVDFETFKAFDLGAPSEGDKALAEGVRGGANPSSFIKKSTAGIQAYADAVEQKANTALRGAGIEPLRFTRRADAPKSKPTLVDELSAKIAKSGYAPPDPYSLVVPRPDLAKINKETDEAFLAISAAADQPGSEGDKARRALEQLSTSAVSPAARAKAKQLFDALPGKNKRTDEAR